MKLLLIGLVILIIVILILLHPLRIMADVSYVDGNIFGKLKLRLFSYFSKPAVTIWDSNKKKGDTKKKSKKKSKKKADNSKKISDEISDEDTLDEQIIKKILSYLPLLKACRKIFVSINGKLDIIYGFYDQKQTALTYPAIFAVIPLIFGVEGKTKWRIKVVPMWGMNTMRLGLVLDIKITIGKLLSSAVKVLWQYLKIRRNKNGKTSD